MRALGGLKLLILDDWGLEPLGSEQRRDLLEIAEERHGRGATLITSQIPVDRWHDLNVVTMTVIGQRIGTISRQQFAEAMLGSFLGLNMDLPNTSQARLEKARAARTCLRLPMTGTALIG
jgi:hypothetical protein